MTKGSRENALRPAESEEAKAESAAGEERSRRSGRRRVMLAVLAIGVVAGVVFGLRTLAFYRHHAETDDAQVEAHIAPVLPKVAGFVTQVLVDDNQRVRSGQLLVRIDDRDFRSRVATAEAALENARAAVAVARAREAAARTEQTKAASDLTRYDRLRSKEEISQQQFEAAKAASEAAGDQADAGRRSIQAATAEVAQKQADLDYARLQLSYTAVVAPSDGTVSRKNVEVGQYVQTGQPLLAIVSDASLWVVANFKETQLKKMRVGQPVEIEIDAYPKSTFHGRVDSIAAATGAKFALLPPDNATGNFTKVVQRIPVKIVLTDPPDPLRPLRAGMNVTSIVKLD